MKLLLILLFVSSFTQSEELICKEISKPPIIDGKLDEGCWNELKEINIDEQSPLHVKLCYLEDKIYFGIELEGTSKSKVEKKKRDDLEILSDEGIEITFFLKENILKEIYYRTIINTEGAIYDAIQKKENEKIKLDVNWNETDAKITKIENKIVIETAIRLWKIDEKTKLKCFIGKRNLKETKGKWYDIKFISKEQTIDLSKLKEEELKSLAKRQIDDPETIEFAKKYIEFLRKFTDYLIDKTISNEGLYSLAEKIMDAIGFSNTQKEFIILPTVKIWIDLRDRSSSIKDSIDYECFTREIALNCKTLNEAIEYAKYNEKITKILERRAFKSEENYRKWREFQLMPFTKAGIEMGKRYKEGREKEQETKQSESETQYETQIDENMPREEYIRSIITRIKSGLEMYLADFGYYPLQLEEMVNKDLSWERYKKSKGNNFNDFIERWHGPYIKDVQKVQELSIEYFLKENGEYEIRCIHLRKAWIGVEVEKVSQEIMKSKNIKQGVLVKKVFPESPAEKVKIKIGDIILKVENTEIKEPKEFNEIIEKYSPGSILKLSILQENKIKEILVPLENLPENK